MDRKLPKCEILRNRRELEQVLFRGKRQRQGPFTLCYAPGSAGRRVGFLTAGKFRTAVARNRVRRRLREFYRNHKTRFPLGFDFLLRANIQAAAMDHAELTRNLLELVELVPATAPHERNLG